MTHPINYAEIMRALMQLGPRLDALIKELDDLSTHAAGRKREAEKAYAEAYMAAEGAAETRKQAAILATEELRWAHDLAERQVSACRAAINALHARIDVGRTIASSMKAEIGLANSGIQP